MASLLEGEIAQTIHDAFASANVFLAATLTRETAVSASDPADPPAPTVATYSCLALEEEWALGLLANSLVRANDANVLILAKSLAVEPQPRDRITLRGRTYAIVPEGIGGRRPVTSDPARATWSCRCE